MYEKYFKRICDIFFSALGIILLSPFLLVIAILIKLEDKGPIFFLQDRVGRKQRVFKIIKFRTMVVNAENIGSGLSIDGESDNRITKIGKILRKLSLDELPQLVNVFKGDMSLVGPRPPVTYYPYKIGEYDRLKANRFLVRPGITGLAQARFRNSVSWDERIEYDLLYVEKVSLIEDVKIIYLTIINILDFKKIYF